MAFTKGKSGNPGKMFNKDNHPRNEDGSSKAGRKRKLPELMEIIADKLGEPLGKKSDINGTEAIILSLRNEAIKGGSAGIRASELLLKYAYGGPVQKVDLTTKGQSINENKDKRAVVKMPDGTILEL